MKLADALNVRTCGDLIDNLPECYCVLGKSAAMGFLHEVALGCGECGGPTDDGDEDDERVIRRKGLGNERTFRPVRGVAALTEKLTRIAGLVSERLVKHDMRAAKWTLKLKTTDFRITTRDTQTKKTGKDKYVRSVKSIVKLLKPLLLEAIGEAEAADTFQLLSGWLKYSAPVNILSISVTLDTSQLFISPYLSTMLFFPAPPAR